MMDTPRPFPYGAISPLEIGFYHCLGHYLIGRPPINGYPRRVIVKFGRTFKMRDREGQNFGWFIEMLRICFRRC